VFLYHRTGKEGTLFLSTNDKHLILKGLEEELASVATEREGLTKRQTALEKTIAGIRDLISLNGGTVPTPADSRPQFPRNAFADMGTVDAAIKYLRIIKKPQTNREVVDALILGGKKSDAKSVSDTIRITLLREADKPSGRVIWTGHQWTLREWQTPEAN
jgi:hypothetical protein